MTQNAIDDFRALAIAELGNELVRAGKAASDTISQFVIHGGTGSSRMHLAIAEDYVDGIARYRKFLWEKWTTYLKPRIGTSTPERQADIKAAVLGEYDNAVDAMGHDLTERSPPHALGSSGSFHGPFTSAAARGRDALKAELGLDMTTPTDKSAGTTVNVTTRDNSPVVIGPGSVTQSVQSGASPAELVAALGNLLTAIEAARAAGSSELDDVVELVNDAKVEAEKEKPNRLKITSLLAGGAQTIQTTAGLSEAWKIVQAAAAMLGVHI